MVAFKGLIVAAVALLSASAAAEADEYDYILLAEQWGPSFCLANSCKAPSDPRRWTIHGLWPTTPSPPYPAYCDDVNYSASAISSIEAQLRQEWPTYNPSGDYHGFWEHEWTKHGSCSLDNSQLNTQFKYFDRTLTLHASHDIATVLDKAGIVPSDSKSYSLSALQNAFRSSWGVLPIFDCSNVNGRNILMEIRPCFDKYSLKVIDCNAYASKAPVLAEEPEREEGSSTVPFLGPRHVARMQHLRQVVEAHLNKAMTEEAPQREARSVKISACSGNFYLPYSY